MTEEKKQPCDHRILTFGSGGYFVICLECQTYWVEDQMDEKFCHSDLAYEDDLRVKKDDNET